MTHVSVSGEGSEHDCGQNSSCELYAVIVCAAASQFIKKTNRFSQVQMMNFFVVPTGSLLQHSALQVKPTMH